MHSLALDVPGFAETEGPVPTGTVTLDRGSAHAILLTPSVLDPLRTYPLITVLHGAGRQDALLARVLADEPDRRQALFLIPRSHQHTWDLICGGPGEDRDFIAGLLGMVGARYRVDPGRRTLVGFSDGASYALALGLSNPRVFSAVIGWAAGFLAIDKANLHADDPKPRILLEHGTFDTMFPFEDVAVPLRDALERLGYTVELRVDEGGIHWPRAEFLPEALDWLFGESDSPSPA